MKKAVLIVFAALSLCGIATAQAQALYARSSVRCMGVELDGSQTLRVQGYGRNRFDAREQAMKNAVWAVVFDGIKEGTGGCEVRPLVTEVNARERHAGYFDLFFSDKGLYHEFVSLRDTRIFSRKKSKDKLGCSFDMTVRVLRPQLKARLKADHIITD